LAGTIAAMRAGMTKLDDPSVPGNDCIDDLQVTLDLWNARDGWSHTASINGLLREHRSTAIRQISRATLLDLRRGCVRLRSAPRASKTSPQVDAWATPT
jgi:hypothetical protein